MTRIKLAFVAFVTAYLPFAGTVAGHNYLAEQRAFDAATIQLRLIEVSGNVTCTPS